jgi:hypothetical protein
MASWPKASWPTTLGSSASAALTEICSCQAKWKIKDQQIQALQKAVESGGWSKLQGATFLDAEHDTVDGPSDEILPTTTDRKAVMGQEVEDIHPLRGNGLT